MKIGVIGAGNIGQAVGSLWVKAGHDVLFASRHPGDLTEYVRSLGKGARAGTAIAAAEHGEVVLVSVPLHAVPSLGGDLREALAGKIAIDTNNPYPQRDGKAAEDAVADGKGSGTWFAKHFRGVHVVKAFNTIYFEDLKKEAHRSGPKLAIPLAADDRGAMSVVAGLVRDAGFEPVEVGTLETSRLFDAGAKAYGKPYDARQLRALLG